MNREFPCSTSEIVAVDIPYIKVLLISILPNSHRNLSVLSLYSTLREAGVETKLLFLPKEDEYRGDLVKEFVRSNKFNLIGVSLMTDGFYFTRLITQDIKGEAPESVVIWGGIHPTLRPEECLRYADRVCIGEGEKTLLSLVERLSKSKDYSDLPGIGSKSPDGKFVVNSPPPLITELDTLPFVRYDWSNFFVQDARGLLPFDHAEYCNYSNYGGEDYTVMNSRSCPFNCSYCCNSFINALYNNCGRVRRRSVDNVISELRHAINTIGTIKFINFMDEQFLTSRQWAEEFAEKYSAQIGLPFIEQLTPGTFDDEIIRKLKGAGLKFVVIGIQSGSEMINKMIFHRNFNRNTIIKGSRILNKNGIYPFYDLIIQNEFEDDSDRDKTVRLLLDLEKPFSLTFYALTPFPGTELEKIYKEKNVLPRINPYEKSYKDYDEEDFYFQLCSIILYTSNYVAEYFFRHKKNGFLRFILKLYFTLTKNRRNRRKTAQETESP